MLEVDEDGVTRDRPTAEVLDPFRGVDLRALEHSIRRPRTFFNAPIIPTAPSTCRSCCSAASS